MKDYKLHDNIAVEYLKKSGSLYRNGWGEYLVGVYVREVGQFYSFVLFLLQIPNLQSCPVMVNPGTIWYSRIDFILLTFVAKRLWTHNLKWIWIYNVFFQFCYISSWYNSKEFSLNERLSNHNFINIVWFLSIFIKETKHFSP